MSDDESFVILNGSLCHDFQDLEISEIEKDSIDAKTTEANLGNKVLANYTNQPPNATPEMVDDNSKNVTKSRLERSVQNNQSVPIENSTSTIRSAESATSGEKNADELKVPILQVSIRNCTCTLALACSMEACAKDIIKLQSFLCEYVELKINSTSQKWRDDMAQYKTQLENCQTEIATLRNENLELKREMQTIMEQIRIANVLKKKEALVDNPRAQIEHSQSQNSATSQYQYQWKPYSGSKR